MNHPPLVALPTQKKKSSWGWVWFVIAMPIAVSAVIAPLIYFVTRPKGDLVGEVDLLGAPGSDVAVTASPGDVLHFRWKRVVIDASTAGTGNRQRNDSLRNDLRGSIITVQATPSGFATCPAYDGSAAESDLSRTTFEMGGANVDCAIPIANAGTYRVRPAVTWKRGVRVFTAKLEVRRQAR